MRNQADGVEASSGRKIGDVDVFDLLVHNWYPNSANYPHPPHFNLELRYELSFHELNVSQKIWPRKTKSRAISPHHLLPFSLTAHRFSFNCLITCKVGHPQHQCFHPALGQCCSSLVHWPLSLHKHLQHMCSDEQPHSH